MRLASCGVQLTGGMSTPWMASSVWQWLQLVRGPYYRQAALCVYMCATKIILECDDTPKTKIIQEVLSVDKPWKKSHQKEALMWCSGSNRWKAFAMVRSYWQSWDDTDFFFSPKWKLVVSSGRRKKIRWSVRPVSLLECFEKVFIALEHFLHFFFTLQHNLDCIMFIIWDHIKSHF